VAFLGVPYFQTAKKISPTDNGKAYLERIIFAVYLVAREVFAFLKSSI
jgi:hypothetical protein